MLCYCLCSLEQTQQKLSSEQSMKICLHRTSLIMLSCHFRYFVLILFGFEKCYILLYCLQIRCILNVLMRVVNHLYRWWIGVGPQVTLYWQSVCDGMTQIWTCLLNSSWTRHGINSIPELELVVNSNSGIGIDYLKTIKLELRNLNWNRDNM